jgi:DNA-binding beta-propeller fold protein YncE
MSAPWGLSVDANNSLYVANEGNGTVTVYPRGSSKPSMTYSQGVPEPLYAFADSTGHIFVSGRSASSNHSKGYVFEYNAGSNVPIAHAQLGAEDDGIAEDANGNLYVAYRKTASHSHGHNGGSIAEFGPNLSKQRLLGIELIHGPEGLLVDRGGNIVVAESGLSSIDVFAPGAKTPSLRIQMPTGQPHELAMQNNETTLWASSQVSDYGVYVYSMPYPLTPSTKPTQYETFFGYSQGIAVSPR